LTYLHRKVIVYL